MFKLLLIIIVLCFAVGCSSVEADAKKAATLINESIEKANDLKFEKSEKLFLQAQEIIDKYREKDNPSDFYEHFARYRDKDKTQIK